MDNLFGCLWTGNEDWFQSVRPVLAKEAEDPVTVKAAAARSNRGFFFFLGTGQPACFSTYQYLLGQNGQVW